MRSLSATASVPGVDGLSGALAGAGGAGIDAWHDLFGHQDHRLASEFAVLPILAGIEQCSERPGLLLKSQQLICHALRRAMNDQLVADRLQRHLVIGLIA